MKILKRSKITSAEFRVLPGQRFYYDGSERAEGEVLEIKEPEGSALVMREKVTPADLPEAGDYIVIAKFKMYDVEAELLDVVRLNAEDALDLMKNRMVIPLDENQWRPNNRRLRKPKDRKLNVLQDPVGIFDDMRSKADEGPKGMPFETYAGLEKKRGTN